MDNSRCYECRRPISSASKIKPCGSCSMRICELCAEFSEDIYECMCPRCHETYYAHPLLEDDDYVGNPWYNERLQKTKLAKKKAVSKAAKRLKMPEDPLLCYECNRPVDDAAKIKPCDWCKNRMCDLCAEFSKDIGEYVCPHCMETYYLDRLHEVGEYLGDAWLRDNQNRS